MWFKDEFTEQNLWGILHSDQNDNRTFVKIRQVIRAVLNLSISKKSILSIISKLPHHHTLPSAHQQIITLPHLRKSAQSASSVCCL